jgi:hypothetical protein
VVVVVVVVVGAGAVAVAVAVVEHLWVMCSPSPAATRPRLLLMHRALAACIAHATQSGRAGDRPAAVS